MQQLVQQQVHTWLNEGWHPQSIIDWFAIQEGPQWLDPDLALQLHQLAMQLNTQQAQFMGNQFVGDPAIHQFVTNVQGGNQAENLQPPAAAGIQSAGQAPAVAKKAGAPPPWVNQAAAQNPPAAGTGLGVGGAQNPHAAGTGLGVGVAQNPPPAGGAGQVVPPVIPPPAVGAGQVVPPVVPPPVGGAGQVAPHAAAGGGPGGVSQHQGLGIPQVQQQGQVPQHQALGIPQVQQQGQGSLFHQNSASHTMDYSFSICQVKPFFKTPRPFPKPNQSCLQFPSGL